MHPLPLLRTKFLIPRRRPATIARPRLLMWLAHHADKRLILLSASPGYGKTTLLAEFAETHRPVCWIHLDAGDSDPATFLASLVKGLGALHPAPFAVRALLYGDADPVHPERILTVLLNELTDSIAHDSTLVLEDYHLVANPAVHALTDYLIENAPPTLHFMLSSRSDPPLALARLRARGQLAELRTADLRLTTDEIAEWMERAAPALAPASVRVLAGKTEGWAAGLQLALSALEGKDAADAERFITLLSGAHPIIFEYLAAEVLQRQPPERQTFLLATSVLTQLNAVSCNTLLERTDSQLILDTLAEQNLFVLRLDDQQPWYRYHLLFREFLLGKLRRDAPARAAALERSAGDYYRAQNELEAAFGHYVQAQAWEQAAEVLAAFAPEQLERGRVAALQQSFALLPETTLRALPHLVLYHGDVLWRLGRAYDALAQYEYARGAFAERGDAMGLARALTALAEIARSQGDYRRARDLAAQAVAQTETSASPNHAVRARALMALAKSEGFLVGMDRGRALAEQAVEESRRAGDALSLRARAGLLRSLGQICWWHGDPQATVRYCQEALRTAPDELSPLAAEATITMATPYLYRRDLDLAQQCAERGLDIAQRLQLNELLPIANATLGNVLTRRGELARAEACLRQAMELSRGLGLETYAHVMAAGFLAYNLCEQQRVDEARQIVESAMYPYAGSADTYEICVCRSVLADIALEAGQLDYAERLYTELVPVDERRQYRIPLAMVYFGLAYIYLKTGRKREGAAMARKSLELIEPTGALQLYLDQGERSRVVREALRAEKIASPFLASLLQTERVEFAPSLDTRLVRVECLGAFRVWLGEREVTQEQWVSVKARDLLAYFCTFRRERVSLDRACDALWQEKATQSKTAFHSALYRLRQALRGAERGMKFILAEAGEYRLDAAYFQVDVDDFDAAFARARAARDEQAAAQWYARAAAFYRGEYLDNLYYDWLLPERRRLNQTALAAFRFLAARHARACEYEMAIQLAQRALVLDPFLEELHRDIMSCYAALGNRSGIVRQYQALTQQLRDELGLSPSPELQALYARLLGA